MVKTIAQLWNGTLVPEADIKEDNPQIKELKILLERNRKHLEQSLNEKEKEIFEKYNDCLKEYVDIFGEQAFCSGFCLGTKITTEALTEQNEMI